MPPRSGPHLSHLYVRFDDHAEDTLNGDTGMVRHPRTMYALIVIDHLYPRQVVLQKDQDNVQAETEEVPSELRE